MKKGLFLFLFVITISIFPQWSSQTAPGPVWFYHIRFFDANNGWALGSGGSVKTTDGGTTWTTAGASVDIREVSVVDQNYAFAIVGDNRFYSTSNGGSNWIYKGNLPILSVGSIAFFSSTTGYAGGNNGSLYKTTNGGSTWSLISAGNYYISDLYFFDEQNGWAARSSGQWSRTTDGGVNWNTGTLGSSDFNSVYASSMQEAYLAGSDGSIYKTTDGGLIWNDLNTGTSAALMDIVQTDESNIWAAGASGTIIHSSDGGENWVTETSGTSSQINALYFIDGNTGWACGTSTTILKYSSSTPETITLISPNGGEDWQAGSVQNITWTSTGVANVKLQYSTDNSLIWTDITASTAAAAGSYAWTVPGSPSSNCRVKIINTANAALSDESNSTFTISPAPSVTLTSPNGGEDWQAGSVQNITWTSIGVANVKLQYSTDNGLNWTDIIASTAAAGGIYTWTVPNNPSANYKVKIISTINAAVSDESNNTFTISPAPFVTITSPNGDEDWQAGSVQNITWISTGVANVKLQYSTDNGLNWTDIVASTAAASGSYAWTVPGSPSSNCKVKVISTINAALSDESNSPFTISPAPAVTLTSPNGGEDWQAGSVQNITWISTGVANVKLQYSTDNGLNWTDIVASTAAASGSYAWTVPGSPSSNCKVKVISTINAALSDENNSPFTISPAPSVTLTSPNGGEDWQAGSVQNITWTSIGVANVKLQYSTDNGLNWTDITASTAAAGGNYSWTVPGNPSANCKVKVISTADAAVADESNSTFTISPAPSVTLTSPNGGEDWQAGSVQNITWTSIGVANVKLQYSTDNGLNWTDITASTAAAGGNYSWTVPGNPSANCKVKVISTADAAVADESNSTFTISPAPSVTLTSPNGGEDWQAGSVQNITWISTGVVNIKLQSSTDNGLNWTDIIASTAAAAGSYSWTVTNNPSANCKVKVISTANSAVSDESNSTFTISPAPFVTLTSPNGGEDWQAGSVQNITWISTGVVNIKLQSSTDNGLNWTDIIASTAAAAGSYSWTVTNNPSANCKVKVISTANSAVSDESNSTFTISPAPSVTLTSPNGGEDWQAGSVQNITWTSSGVANIKLQYSIDNGLNWTDIIASTAAAAGSYSWTVPNNPSSNCKVKILNSANAALADESNATFTISPAPLVTLISPNGGEDWQAGSVQNITWISTGVANVKLQYSTDNGLNWTDIIASTAAAAGSYSWTVPNNPSSNCKVKILNSANAALADESNAAFTISPAPSVTLTSPNGGEDWLAGSVHNITWTSSGVENVKLQYYTAAGMWHDIIANIPASAGSYSWTVPNEQSMTCKVRIFSTATLAIVDESDNTFTITPVYVRIVSPNGGENWLAGSVHNITWTSSGVDNVKLQYYTTAGMWHDIIASIPASAGSYAWTVPSEPSSTCKVRILNPENIAVQDESNSTFTISIPSITLLSPNGGENYFVDSIYEIKWTSSNIQKLRIMYSIYPGSSWIIIDSAADASSGKYSWKIPGTISGTCLLRIADAENAQLFDESTEYFSILIPQLLKLTSPSGGEKWLYDFAYDITWVTNLDGNVQISGSTNMGRNWFVISTVPASHGKYKWKIRSVNSSINCLIKISSLDYSLLDRSASVFSIGSFYLTTPNGNENWTVGSQKTITWGNIYTPFESIRIEYSTNDGSNWIVVAEDRPIADKNYSWTVPNTPSERCRIKISAVGNPQIADSSTYIFKISSAPYLEIISPAGGERWLAGSPQVITWNTSNVANVKLEYTTNNGTSWNIIAASTPSRNSSFTWTLPRAEVPVCRVRISDVSNTAVADTSNSFNIVGSTVDLLYPNGGEKLLAGSLDSIKWQSQNVVTNKLYYSTNNGRTWAGINFNVPDAGKKYTWTVPNISSTNYLIKIKDANNNSTDSSSAIFTVASLKVTIPDGGELWQPGSVQNITWSTSNIAKIKLEYTTNNGIAWIGIQDNLDPGNGNGSYLWNLPAEISSSNCKIRILESGRPDIKDESNNTFSITNAALIIINKPAGGEKLFIGESYDITWRASNVNTLKIEYSKDGASWVQITNNAQAGSFKYTWSFNDLLPGNYKIKVSDRYNPAVYDESQVFIITNQPTLALLTPNGGESLIAGKMYDIKWECTGVENIKILISFNIGAFRTTWETICNSYPAGEGRFSWRVPERNSSSCKVKILDAANQEFSDLSNQQFSIKIPQILVEFPNGGEFLNSGSSVVIKWKSISSIQNLRLEYSINGSKWSTIANRVNSTVRNYSWTVPAALNNACKLRISSSDDKNIFDESDESFSIINTGSCQWIHLLAPELGIRDPRDSMLIVQDVLYDLESVYFLDDFKGFIAGTHIVAKTTNGGYDWSVVTDPETCPKLKSLIFVNEQVGYAAGRFGGFIKTTNGGSNWVDKSFGNSTDLNCVYFTSPEVGYVAGNNGYLVKTINGGNTWTIQSSGTSANLYNIQFINDNSGWVCGASGTLLKTTDGGNTWFTQATNTVADLNDISMISENIGLLCANNGQILKSTDAGTTWNAQNVVTSNLNSIHFSTSNTGVAVGDGGLIIYTSDGGNAWTTQNSHTQVDLTSVWQMNPTRIWAVGKNDQSSNLAEVLKYDNVELEIISPVEGTELKLNETFQLRYKSKSVPRVSLGYQDHDSHRKGGTQLMINPLQQIGGNDLFISNEEKIITTIRNENGSDKGKIVLKCILNDYIADTITVSTSLMKHPGWTHEYLDEQFNEYYSVKDIKFTDSQNGLLTAQHHDPLGTFHIGLIYRTSDGGATWHRQSRLADRFYLLNTGIGWYSYFVATGNSYYDSTTVYKTTDGGITWNYASNWEGCLYFFDEHSGWRANGSRHLEKTIDGGSHWIQSDITFDNEPSKVRFWGNSGIAWGDNKNIARTTNRGDTWEFLNIPVPAGNSEVHLRDISFVDQSTGWAIANIDNISCVFKSTDSGKSWFEIYHQQFSDFSYVQFLTRNIGYVAAGNNILKTIDGGNHWTNIPCNAQVNAMYFINANTGWVGTNNGNLIYTSTGGNLPSVSKDITESEILLLDQYNLSENYPNPFNPSTNIEYALPKDSRVKVEVYSILGEKVAELVNGVEQAGYYSKHWKADNLASGIYLLRIEAESLEDKELFVKTLKMILMK